MALVSGILFTANNFMVNRYSVSACHLVLVRTLLQMLVYTAYCLARSEPLLPGPPKQKMFILLQGWSQLGKPSKKEVTNVTLQEGDLERLHVTKKTIVSKSFLSNFKPV